MAVNIQQTADGNATFGPGSITFSGLTYQKVTDAISAAGTTQATGTQLTSMVNNVSTVGAGSGVNLPASAAGANVVVINTGANPLLVYPLIGATDTINGIAATIGVSIFPGTVALFKSTLAGAWVTMPATTKSAGFNTNSTASGAITLTAANITGGAASVDLALTGAQGGGVNAQLPTVAAMEAALHAPAIGASYRLRIINEGSTQIITVTTNTGWTLTGTMTIANNTWREFVVTLTSLSAATLQNVAVGTFS